MSERKMNMLVAIAAGWFAVSVPVGIVVGRMLARASDPLDAEAEPALPPRTASHSSVASHIIPFPQPVQPTPLRIERQD